MRILARICVIVGGDEYLPSFKSYEKMNLAKRRKSLIIMDSLLLYFLIKIVIETIRSHVY